MAKCPSKVIGLTKSAAKQLLSLQLLNVFLCCVKSNSSECVCLCVCVLVEKVGGGRMTKECLPWWGFN